MTLKADATIARRPWLDYQPVPAGSQNLLDIGHTFLGLLGIAEVAVALLPVPSALLSRLDTARTHLQDSLAANPILTGPLLRALDEANEAVDGLLDWMVGEQTSGFGQVIGHLDAVWLAREWES
jgi:hypothetical protein